MKNKININQIKGYAMVFAAGALWGTNGFFVSVLNQLGIESATVAFLRISMGAVILVPMMLIMGGKKLFKIDKYGLIACVALGVFSQALFNYSYNEAIDHIGVAMASVLSYTSPIFVCLMSRLFFKEKIGKVKVIALAVNIMGCVLTATGGDFTAIRFSVYGACAAVTAGFLYALMTIISTTAKSYHPLTIVFYSFISGSAALAVMAKPWESIGQAAGLPLLLAAVVYGLLPTVLAYFIYLKGLGKGLETSKVPVVASVEAVVATSIGIFVFSESFGFFKLIGIGMVILSIAIMSMAKQK